MFKDVNGLMSGDNFGEPFDPAMLSWGLFAESGNPCFYLLYKDPLLGSRTIGSEN